MPDISAVQNQIDVVSQTLDFSLPGGLVFSPTYLQAGLIVFLIFLLILTMGQLRHRLNQWTLKGAMPGIAFGFALALILEGLFLIGGRTLFTEVIGWKNAPKPISNVLDASRTKLVTVLGVTNTIEETQAQDSATPERVIQSYQSLTPKQAQSVKNIICTQYSE